MIGLKNSYESINPWEVTEEALNKLFEIEQDMWARWIWEYIKCDSCSKIYSKKMIYGDGWVLELPKAVQLETVSHIERVLFHWKLPSCTCCWGETRHVYERDEYLPEMRKRYDRRESFLTVAKNPDDQIIWFMDAYVSSLDEIYQDEFQQHFSSLLLDEIYQRYWFHPSKKFMTFASLWTDDKNKSLLTILSLIRAFFASMDEKYDEMPWIFESIIGSSTYCIFSLMWADKMKVNKRQEFLLEWTRNDSIQTDILLQSKVVEKYKSRFNVRSRQVVMYSRELEREGVYA